LADADVQRRVVEDRQSKILDAVGEVVLDRGISGLTTALVARHARVAPGKFYELYADKYAVLRAAADRNLRRFFDAFGEALDGREDLDMVEVSVMAVDVWIECCRRDPAFRVLRFWRAPEVLGGEEGDTEVQFVRALVRFAHSRFGMPDTPETRRGMTLAAKFVLDPIDYAFELNPQGDEKVLDQVREVLGFHLRSWQAAV
jgi:AcrR family transcriptional regulator